MLEKKATAASLVIRFITIDAVGALFASATGLGPSESFKVAGHWPGFSIQSFGTGRFLDPATLRANADMPTDPIVVEGMDEQLAGLGVMPLCAVTVENADEKFVEKGPKGQARWNATQPVPLSVEVSTRSVRFRSFEGTPPSLASDGRTAPRVTRSGEGWVVRAVSGSVVCGTESEVVRLDGLDQLRLKPGRARSDHGRVPVRIESDSAELREGFPPVPVELNGSSVPPQLQVLGSQLVEGGSSGQVEVSATSTVAGARPSTA